MAHDVDAKVLLHPVTVDVLRSLVDGEGHGSHECYASHRGSHTYKEENITVRKMIQGDGESVRERGWGKGGDMRGNRAKGGTKRKGDM